ncbi:MAG TPA: peptidyl-prolyl cis-trans isomerase [bacterium]
MKIKDRKFLAAILLFLLFSGVALPRALIDSVVASVNGTPITLSELKTAMKSILEKNNWKALKAEDKNSLLDEIISRRLLYLECNRIGINVTNEEIEKSVNEVSSVNSMTREELKDTLKKKGIYWKEYQQEIRFRILKEKVLQSIIFPRIGERREALEQFYLQNKDKFKTAESLHLLHAVIPVPQFGESQAAQKAGKIYKAVKAGEGLSDAYRRNIGAPLDSSTADLGFVYKEELLPELEKAVFNLPAGRITQPLRAKGGYHLFFVLERRSSAIKSFDDAMPEIKELYFKEKSEELYEEWLEGLKGKYVIKKIEEQL